MKTVYFICLSIIFFTASFDAKTIEKIETTTNGWNPGLFDFNSISSGKNGPDPFNFSDTYFNLEPKFNYADIHDFHKIKQKLPKKACFSLLHTNIQSLNHNFEQLEILINSLEFNFDIIALSEVWCPDEKLTFNPGILKGYHSYIGTIQ